MAVVRVDGPSLTARGVAAARLQLERPAAPTGDPGAEERLARSLAQEAEEMAGEVTDGGAAERPARQERRERQERRQPGGDFFAFLTARTRFFDDAVLRAIDGGVRQIVILGAGYDGRPLRFRTPGVRFFEVDHPATQADKRLRLVDVGAATDDIAFVPADFTEPGLATALTAGGYDRQQRSLVTCEGVLRYLPEPWFRELLSVTCEMAAPGSELAVSISTRPPPTGDGPDARGPSEDRRWLDAIGEPVLTVPPSHVALAWLDDAGWTVHSVVDIADEQPGSRQGRLLVRARR